MTVKSICGVILAADDPAALATFYAAAFGAREIIAPHDEGFGMTATFADPEGNHFEVVELAYDFGAANAIEPGDDVR